MNRRMWQGWRERNSVCGAAQSECRSALPQCADEIHVTAIGRKVDPVPIGQPGWHWAVFELDRNEEDAAFRLHVSSVQGEFDLFIDVSSLRHAGRRQTDNDDVGLSDRFWDLLFPPSAC